MKSSSGCDGTRVAVNLVIYVVLGGMVQGQ
jgi:hypothetical protein